MWGNNRWIPDRWVLVRLTDNGQSTLHVLCGWTGSYLDGASWRWSSGIERIEPEAHGWTVHTASSQYVLRPGRTGFTALTSDVWASMQQETAQHGYTVELVELETVCDRCL